MDYSTLPAISALSDCVSIAKLDDIKVVRIQHEKATAAISLHGGHVLSFIPNGQQELIWMSQEAQFDGKAAIRGGIPVCWPWFGRIAAPAHGFARTTQWELVEHRENDKGVIVELALFPSEETHDIWPHLFDVRLVIEVAEQMKVSLHIINIDDEEWTFSGALHTYLNVGNIRQTKTTGMGPQYLDSLQGGKQCEGGDALVLTDTIDRVYTQPEAQINVHDPIINRVITVENQGHNSAVLWNPWAEGAQSMGDMSDEGYQTMICVESSVHANDITQGVTLQPGETHVLSTVIGA